MNQILGISTFALQNFIFVLNDGTSFSLTIRYVPNQIGWFITNLTYGTFVLNGVRITNLLNIFHQYSNQIPFGLACISPSAREPSQQQDFAAGASGLWVLNAAEAALYNSFITSDGVITS